MCFVVRCIGAVGAAAFDTALFAIVAHTYPDKVAKMLVCLTVLHSTKTFIWFDSQLGYDIENVMFSDSIVDSQTIWYVGNWKLPTNQPISVKLKFEGILFWNGIVSMVFHKFRMK